MTSIEIQDLDGTVIQEQPIKPPKEDNPKAKSRSKSSSDKPVRTTSMAKPKAKKDILYEQTPETSREPVDQPTASVVEPVIEPIKEDVKEPPITEIEIPPPIEEVPAPKKIPKPKGHRPIKEDKPDLREKQQCIKCGKMVSIHALRFTHHKKCEALQKPDQIPDPKPEHVESNRSDINIEAVIADHFNKRKQDIAIKKKERYKKLISSAI